MDTHDGIGNREVCGEVCEEVCGKSRRETMRDDREMKGKMRPIAETSDD